MASTNEERVQRSDSPAEIPVIEEEEDENDLSMNDNNDEESEPDVEETLTIDEVLEKVGGFGRFQVLMVNLMGYIWFVDGLIVFSMIFFNLTDEKGIPLPGTVSDSFKLIGEKQWLVSLTGSLFFVGWLIGAGAFGLIGDRYGRKRTLLISSLVLLSGSIGSVISPSYAVFLVFRVVSGFGIGGQGLMAWVLVAEYWPPKSRTIAGSLFHSYYALGLMILSLISYLLEGQNWRIFIIVSSAPILVMYGYWKLIPESARWLLVNGKENEATTILKEIARRNRRPLPTGRVVAQDPRPGGDTTPRSPNRNREDSGQFFPGRTESTLILTHKSITDDIELIAPPVLKIHRRFGVLSELCSKGPMRVRTIIICYSWLVASLTYYGLSLYAGQLSGSPHLNAFLSGLMEVIAYIITVFVVRMGRRRAVMLFFGFCGFCCLAVLFSPPVWLEVLLAMAGKFGTSGAFASIYLFSTELLPTTVRSSGIGLASQTARLGGISAPIAVMLGRGGLVLWGLLAVTGVLLVFMLPETLKRPLPETVADVMRQGEKKKGIRLRKFVNKLMRKPKPREFWTLDDEREQ